MTSQQNATLGGPYSPQRPGVVQTGPGVWPLVVPDGSVAVAAPRRSGRPLQALVGAAAGRLAPYGSHAVPVGRRDAASAAVSAAVTDPAH